MVCDNSCSNYNLGEPLFTKNLWASHLAYHTSQTVDRTEKKNNVNFLLSKARYEHLNKMDSSFKDRRPILEAEAHKLNPGIP